MPIVRWRCYWPRFEELRRRPPFYASGVTWRWSPSAMLTRNSWSTPILSLMPLPTDSSNSRSGKKKNRFRCYQPGPPRNPPEIWRNRTGTENWIAGFSEQLAVLGGIGTDVAPPEIELAAIPGSKSLSVPDLPARDPRYWSCRFYWPDIVDPEFPYGEGLLLQLRSAVSHLNEVWAVEHGGIILSEFSDVLPWEWIYDAARWTYDESRHCRMGQNRLEAWGFDPSEVPLGSYIYESAKGAEPIYRLGMLYFFETKNIGRKPERTAVFKEIGDAASEHDMDFDWADETIHATYGNRWLRALHELHPEKFPAAAKIRDDCEFMVKSMIASASAAEKIAISERAHRMIQRANELATQ